MKNEVSELTSETEETTIQKLQDEIKECKAILKCGVCFDRPKEVMGHWATESTYSGLCRFVSEPRCRYLGFNYYLHPSQIHVSLLYSYMRQPILLPPLMAFLFLSLFFLLLLLFFFWQVVITKCFHLFCSPCIQRNLEIRHRKCPGCGTPFGQSDVREVKI